MTYTVTIGVDSVVVQIPDEGPATFMFGIGFSLAEALVVSTEYVIQRLREAGQHV